MSDITINVKAPSVNVNATPQSNVIAPKMQMIRGGSVTVDDELSLTSENPVQNKVVTAALNEKADIITDTASGSIASFPDGADGLPVKSLVCNIEPVQDLNGYENPWPPGGGKNLLDYDAVFASFNNGDGSFTGTNSAGGITTVRIPLGSYIGKTVTLSLTVTAHEQIPSVWYLRGIINGVSNATSNTNRILATENTPKRIYQTCTPETENDLISLSYSSGVGSITVRDLQLEVGDSPTEWASYSNICPISGWTGANIHVSPTTDARDGKTYSVSFAEAGTVYGGTLDVTTGVLTVDRAMVDLGTLNYGYNATYKVFSAYKGDIKAHGMCISSQYKYGDGVSAPDMTCCLGYAGWFINTIVIKDSHYTDAATFKTAMSGVQLVYELATPVEYQLTPREVTTLLGTNNIWANTGDVEVKYPADTKLYIDNLIASLSS